MVTFDYWIWRGLKGRLIELSEDNALAKLEDKGLPVIQEDDNKELLDFRSHWEEFPDLLKSAIFSTCMSRRYRLAKAKHDWIRKRAYYLAKLRTSLYYQTLKACAEAYERKLNQ